MLCKSLKNKISLIELANSPQFHQELLKEQEQLFSNNPEDSYYSIKQTAKMEKLDSFVRETLRMYTDTGGFDFLFSVMIFINDNEIFLF